MAKKKTHNNDTGANLGFEALLWAAANALRNKMHAAEYKKVVLGLIFHAHGNGNSPTGNGDKAKADIPVYGQEWIYTMWRLAKMNIAIRDIDGQIVHSDTFHNDRPSNLNTHFIPANSRFKTSDTGSHRFKDDARWQYGAPPKGNDNFPWVQHIVHHLVSAGVTDSYGPGHTSYSAWLGSRCKRGCAASIHNVVESGIQFGSQPIHA